MKQVNKKYSRNDNQKTKKSWIPLVLLTIGMLLVG